MPSVSKGNMALYTDCLIMCAQDSQVFYSIDGNFGLCRKKSSGKSVRPPLHEDTIFMKQESVDQYVQGYGKIEALFNKV